MMPKRRDSVSELLLAIRNHNDENYKDIKIDEKAKGLQLRYKEMIRSMSNSQNMEELQAYAMQQLQSDQQIQASSANVVLASILDKLEEVMSHPN
jgi:hypothetical protein